MFSDQFRRGESDKSKLSGVKSSRLISGLSDVAWKAFQSVNQRLPEGEAIRPNWAPGPLLKSYERTAPPLGFPRETDSLCPSCVKEVRNAVITGEHHDARLREARPLRLKRDADADRECFESAQRALRFRARIEPALQVRLGDDARSE